MPIKPKQAKGFPIYSQVRTKSRALGKISQTKRPQNVPSKIGSKRPGLQALRSRRIKAIGKVLVINVGATTTKLAIYSGSELISEVSLKYEANTKAKSVMSELPDRLREVKKYLSQAGYSVIDFACVMARGGLLAPMSAGVYRISKKMCAHLRSSKYGEHPSNLSALIANELVKGTPVPAFIADPVVVDEFIPLARISGYPGIERASRQHTLNVRATCKLAARKLGIPFKKLNAVCAHLGSGFSIVTVKNGKLIDNADGLLGEGPFAIERAGVLPLRRVLDLAEKFKDRKALEYQLSKCSGIKGYLGTNDFQEVLRRIDAGDKKARLIFDAMVYQIAKNIGMYSAPLMGRQHAVIITGALANSKKLVSEIRKYVRWVAPTFLVYPGENEMEALRDLAYCALLGEEEIQEYRG